MLNKTSKKILSVAMAAAMTVNMLPLTAFAMEEYVYMSVSFDGQYINGKNDSPMAYIPVSFEALEAVDLEEYGLGEYRYDEDGDGSYDTTALQLVIYAHENLYGGDWSEVTFTGAPGSSYFEGGIFGFDENLNYYLNGQYPLAGEGWGATSDQIVLEAGDFIDLAGFSSWDFYMDSNYGFHFFADENDDITHTYTAESDEALDVKLVRSYSGMGTGAVLYDEAGYDIFYGTELYGDADSVTTDDNGYASITFPSAGKWYLWADGGYGSEYSDVIVSAPAYAEVTVTAKEEPAPEVPREAQDVSDVLDATMEQLANTVTEPVFGTTAGEWTVFSLARGGYYAKDNAYFSNYYDRIVETVNTEAAKVNMNGALHKSKSTENSRLIVALSALGKDATSVGDWNLVKAYDENKFSWIKKQGLNGTIWALIALDSNNYETTSVDEKGKSIRQQCVDAIIEAQHDDGGWSLMANKTFPSDPDITGMALTALYPYRDQQEVKAACEEAFACLSAIQNDDGTYSSGGAKCSESCAWVIVSTTTWGINPDTDSRFIKNGKSVVDALLAHYLSDSATFQHIIGAGSNAMATDQSCYALVAYDRFMNKQTALYDYSDVEFEKVEADDNNGSGDKTDVSKIKINAMMSLPEKVNPDQEFNAIISVDNWDNEAGYKMIDFVMTIPQEFDVCDVAACESLKGGEVSYNFEKENGTLRVAYFDANKHSDITVTAASGETFSADLFSIKLKTNEKATYEISLDGMSAKTSSDSEDETAMTIIGTDGVKGSVQVVSGVSFSAVELYRGDDIDLIPSTKKAVAVAVTGIEGRPALTYKDGTNTIEFNYSPEITAKTNIAAYVALVDASVVMENFVNAANFTVGEEVDTVLTFGDSNNDSVVNAQDALAAVDAWIRKTKITTDEQILTLNVNGDSRINTFDALGIVEKFVNGADFGVVTKAAAVANTSK